MFNKDMKEQNQCECGNELSTVIMGHPSGVKAGDKMCSKCNRVYIASPTQQEDTGCVHGAQNFCDCQKADNLLKPQQEGKCNQDKDCKCGKECGFNQFKDAIYGNILKSNTKLFSDWRLKANELAEIYDIEVPSKSQEIKIVPSPRIDYCGACKKDHGYDCPLDWKREEAEAFYKFTDNCRNGRIKDFDAQIADYWLSRIEKLIESAREEWYKKGITDKRVWNGVYAIGAEEEKARLIAIAEEMSDFELENGNTQAEQILQHFITKAQLPANKD